MAQVLGWSCSKESSAWVSSLCDPMDRHDLVIGARPPEALAGMMETVLEGQQAVPG